MIFDVCRCGAEFHVGYGGLHAATDERFAHTEWLAAHASCRVVAQEQEREIVRSEVLRELLEWEAHYMQQARGGDQSGRSDARADAAREIHDNLRRSWESRELVANSKPAARL